MMRRRRRVTTKGSACRLLAFVLINSLLCVRLVSAHYLASEQQHHQLHKHSHHHQQHRHLGDHNFNHQDDEQQQQQQHTKHQQQSHSSSPTSQQQQVATSLPSIGHLCSSLPKAHAKHLKLCKLIKHSPNADEAVALGAARGLAECRNQFKTERWNCSHSSGDHHLLIGKMAQSVGNRESGFVQAIAAAGIVHSIATACSVGSLSDCACDKTRIGLIRQKDQTWKWGGCSNNIRHGMMFAKHLVELLDAVHLHQAQTSAAKNFDSSEEMLDSASSELMMADESSGGHKYGYHRQHNAHPVQHHQHPTKRRLVRRSLSGKNREPNQVVRSYRHMGDPMEQSPNEDNHRQQQQHQASNFCQQNHNLSQTTHYQLIKSLLSKNSLEKHQEFRLAMNAHNNKVGRMAVSKNMEIKCRCHGLSGSCSLKTCWLKLPDFQQIGNYLKRKYETSVHLPSGVNMNKLIPMMDRGEISAILASSSADSNEQSSDARAATTAESQQYQQRPPPEFAPLVSSPSRDHYQAPEPMSLPANAPALFNYYERHKQLEHRTNQTSNNDPQPVVTTSHSTGGLSNHTTRGSTKPASVELEDENELVLMHNVVPMTQQQYQSLLKEMKLCNTMATNVIHSVTTTNHLSTRDLQHQAQLLGAVELGSTSSAYNELKQGTYLHKKITSSAAAAPHFGHNPKQQLTQLLHPNVRDDLIHLHKSPDYCSADTRHGFAGVQERVCSENPSAPNSCDKLCCGRGYEARETQLKYDCHCQFQYCCKIHCSYCHKRVVEFVCK